ncbi:MAG TPA: hypothetical protein VLH18_08225 [Candidatus Limnocylindrales bacterium]|nr:hypothetical protein [Candidatus Limnocylindrales bacterium]
MQAWNKISRMPFSGIRKLQDELLSKMINQELAVRHPHYRALFKELRIDPAGIKRVEDLSRLPFTEKKDMQPPKNDLLYPKRFVLEMPGKEETPSKKGGFKFFGKKDTGENPLDYRFSSLYYTGGRTAKPVPIEYTLYDLENLKETGARAFDILGLTRDDTLINAFTYAPNVYFWQMFYSTIGIGSTALQTGGGKVLGLEKILKAMDNMEASVLAAAPGYAMFALQTLSHFGFSAQNLERIITGNDYTPMVVVERLRTLMQQVGARDNRVQRIYFVSEAKSGWAECEPGFGYHTNPDHMLVEVVDPESGAVKNEGEPGEVVITHLDSRGTVLLRFRTGDIATGGITTEPCPHCRRTVPRILGDIERKTNIFDMQTVNGSIQLDGNALRKTMFGRDDVLLWYTEIVSSDAKDALKVVVKGVSGTDEQALMKSLEQGLRDELKVPVTVESSALDAIANKIGLEKNITEQNIFDKRQV